MAIDLFRLVKGLRIEADDLSSTADILQGIGLPGGDAAEQDDASVGSLYLRNDSTADSLQVYYKHTTANASSDDWKVLADKDYVDAIAQGLSWREPVLVMDATTYANIAAAEAIANLANAVDGVGLTPGDRILFTDLTAGNENVYIVSGTNGAWTFTEAPNAATDGDANMVQSGSSADTQWVYDGAQWVQFGGAAGASELAFIRDFIGKTGAGAEFPAYTSTDVVDTADNLEVAIGRLDSAMGDGVVTNQAGNWPLSDDLNWDGATSAVNTGTLGVTGAINELNNAIGDQTFTSAGTNVVDGASNASNIDALNEALIAIQQSNLEVSGSQAAATLTTVDTIALADATEVKWVIQLRETGTPANRRAFEIHALNDGATLVDHTKYAVLSLGSSIAGLVCDVTIAGTDMLLTVNSTTGVDYVVKRITYSAF